MEIEVNGLVSYAPVATSLKVAILTPFGSSSTFNSSLPYSTEI